MSLASEVRQEIQWLPWSEEAFALARREDKLVLLDIGATWCHWCHVMDRVTYQDPRVVELVGRHFIPIRVDRDRRPDIDARYQREMAILAGGGGWPLTGFLTPNGELLFGGTFFPPTGSGGQIGFLDLAPLVVKSYREKKGALAEQLRGVRQEIVKYEQREHISPAAPSVDLVKLAFERLYEQFDRDNGGFGVGPGPKFPQPFAIEWALAMDDRFADPRALEIVHKTLTGMALGGIHDHLGGGFHRYAIDQMWQVPHFEKLLPVNASALRNYLHAWQATGNALYRETAAGILQFLTYVLADREHGNFYGSQDADTPAGDDGGYFTWKRDEIETLLTKEEARLVVALYGVEHEKQDVHGAPGQNVLRIVRPLDEVAGDMGLTLEQAAALHYSATDKLKAARERRTTPPVDRTIYTNWNALTVSAFLEASVVLGQVEYRELALRTLDRLRRELVHPDGGMFHYLEDGRAHVHGLLTDQVMMAHALLDAFEVTGRWEYAREAIALADFMLTRLWDEARGGFFDLAPDLHALGSLSYGRKDLEDGEVPSGNAAASILLGRLEALTGAERYSKHAEELLHAFSAALPDLQPFGGALAVAILQHIEPAPAVIIVGVPDDPLTEALHRAALGVYRPGKAVLRFAPGMDPEPPYPPSPDGRPVAYVCARKTCAPPTSDPATLERLIREFGRKAPAD